MYLVLFEPVVFSHSNRGILVTIGQGYDKFQIWMFENLSVIVPAIMKPPIGFYGTGQFCAEGQCNDAVCSKNKQCISPSTIGCECKIGFITGEEEECYDIDECETEAGLRIQQFSFVKNHFFDKIYPIKQI